jgi:hypothetical protein
MRDIVLVLSSIVMVCPSYGAESSLRDLLPESRKEFVWKTHQALTEGLIFKYPDFITTSGRNPVSLLGKKVNSPDLCSESDSDPPEVTYWDYQAWISVGEDSLFETVALDFKSVDFGSAESIREEGLERIQIGPFKGYRGHKGYHGCGAVIYYMQVSKEKVLRLESSYTLNHHFRGKDDTLSEKAVRAISEEIVKSFKISK